MIYGGALSSRRWRSRDDLCLEESDLDQRLPEFTRGSASSAVARLAALGIRPGRYSGAEQVFASGAAGLAAAMEPSTCTVLDTGSLAVASRTTGETTTFAFRNDRWCWSPYPGLTIEGTPRRLGAIVVIDFVAWERSTRQPAARLYLAWAG
jgi:hypothetical protein